MKRVLLVLLLLIFGSYEPVIKPVNAKINNLIPAKINYNFVIEPNLTYIPPVLFIPPEPPELPELPKPNNTPKKLYIKSDINWDAIANCESHGDWSINTGNGYYGGLQFDHSTWIASGGGQYSDNANLTSRENQIDIAKGLSLSHWPVCGRRGIE